MFVSQFDRMFARFQDQHAQAEQAERARKRQRLERERASQQATQVAEEHYAAYVNGLATDPSTDPSTDPNRFKTPYGNRDHSRPIRRHKLTHKLEPFEHSLPHEAPSTPTAPFAEAVVTDAPGKPRSALVKDFQYAVAYKASYKTPASSSSPAQHKLFAVARQPMPLAQWTAFFETPNVRESPLSAFTANLENYKQTALRNGGYFDDLNLATYTKNINENKNENDNDNNDGSETSDVEDKTSDNPFRAACVCVYSPYLPFNKMESKLKYFAYIKKMGARPEHNYFRVFAYADPPMRESGWKSMFPPRTVSVKKIDGPFDENMNYKLRLDKGQLEEWGVRPYRTKKPKDKAK
jgi:hypothetical protein